MLYFCVHLPFFYGNILTSAFRSISVTLWSKNPDFLSNFQYTHKCYYTWKNALSLIKLVINSLLQHGMFVKMLCPFLVVGFFLAKMSKTSLYIILRTSVLH